MDLSTILTVPNLINFIVAIGIFSVKNELKHINESIREAKETAAQAHKRIDEILKTFR